MRFRDWLEKHKTLSMIVLAALILRFGLLTYGLATQGNNYFFSFDDAYGYVEPAQSMLAGEGFSVDYYGVRYPETSRTPGYPLLITASLWAFKSVIPLIVLQLLLAAIVLPLLAWRLVFEITGNSRFSLLAAAVSTLEPLGLIVSTLILTEVVFMITLWSASILFLQAMRSPYETRRDLTLASILLGVSALIRPTGLYLVPIFALVWVLKKLSFRPWRFREAAVGSAIIVLASAAVFYPWIMRNQRVAGLNSLTSFSGIVPYYFTGSSVISLATGIPFAEARQSLRLKARADGLTELRDPKNVPYYQREASRIIREHPKEFLKLIPLSAFHFFTHDGYLDAVLQIGMLSGAPQSSPNITAIARGNFSEIFSILGRFISWPWVIFIAARLAWVAIFVLALVGATRALIREPNRRLETIFAISLVAAFALTSSMVGLAVTGRHRIPVNIFIVPFAAMGTIWIWNRVVTLLKREKISAVQSAADLQR